MDWTSWLIFLYGGWTDSRPGSIMPEKSPDQGRNSSDVAIHEFSLGPVSRCKGAMECISRPFTAELRQGARSMLEITRSGLRVFRHSMALGWGRRGKPRRGLLCPQAQWCSDRHNSFVLHLRMLLLCEACEASYNWGVRMDYPQKLHCHLWGSNLGHSIIQPCYPKSTGSIISPKSVT